MVRVTVFQYTYSHSKNESKQAYQIFKGFYCFQKTGSTLTLVGKLFLLMTRIHSCWIFFLENFSCLLEAWRTVRRKFRKFRKNIERNSIQQKMKNKLLQKTQTKHVYKLFKNQPVDPFQSLCKSLKTNNHLFPLYHPDKSVFQVP